MSIVEIQRVIYLHCCDNDPNKKSTVTGLDDQATGQEERKRPYVLCKVTINSEERTKERRGNRAMMGHSAEWRGYLRASLIPQADTVNKLATFYAGPP